MSKNIILSNVEKFLKKEVESPSHTDDKQQKWKTALKYLPDDDCFVIYDTESSIKCVFDEDNFRKEVEKKGKKENLDSKFDLNNFMYIIIFHYKLLFFNILI